MSVRWLVASLAVLLVSGCDGIGARPEAGLGTPGPPGLASPAPPGANVLFYVSNQSSLDDPVRIEVSIDGRRVLVDDFLVEGQHNWIEYGIRLDPGEHTVRALSGTGASGEAVITVPASRDHAVVVEYWHYEDAAGRHFTITEHEPPVTFM